MTNLQQAYLERMQATSGYGRISESAGSPSVRLPVNPLPVDTLNNLQAQSDQVLRRVAALESWMTEVTRRLDDWTEVTRGGIADLRSEIGAVKLEQRFAQTLRSSGGDASARQTPLAHSVATGTPTGRSEASVEVMGEELKKRLEVYERKLSAIHSEHMFDATTMKERLEAALRESDNQMSRADELQALMKEEQGRRALLFARLEAVEASMQDLRTSQRDFASTPEATENLLRAEMKQEVQRLREDLGGLGLARGSDDMARRCEELDRRMSELHHMVEASVRGADALQCRCDILENRFESGAGAVSEDLLQTHAAFSQESTTQLRNELRKEMLTLRDELELRSTEQHQSMAQMEASRMDLQRKQEASERQLMEWKQDHLSETVALRGRLEESVGEHHANQVGLGDIKQEVNDERHRRREEMCAVRSRLEALEKLEAAPRVSMEPREDLGETKASLARLAKDLNVMREEHDQAISSLGSLTELVAKTATAGIQRTEERLAADLTGKRRDFERSLVHHREQMEREAKAIIAEVKNLSPTLLAAGGCAGQLDVSDDRMEVALRHIDNLARELRSEVLAQTSAAAAQTAQLEGNFNGDLKRMGGILADCVSQVKGIQVELSKLTLSKFESRLSSVELGLSKLGAMQDEISESTDTGKSRSPTETSSDQGMKWLNTLTKVQLACGPSGPGPVSGVATPLANNSRGSSRDARGPLRQGLKDRLHGIHSSIYQVLGVLESYGVDEDSTVLSSNDGGGSMSVPLPFRPEGTFEKQLRESKGMAPKKGPRLSAVNEMRASHDNLHFSEKRDSFIGLAQTTMNSPRNDSFGAGFGNERSPSPSALSRSHHAPSMHGLVNAATGPPRVVTKGFTAPPSTGASRELSPTRGPGSARPGSSMNLRPSLVERPSQGAPRLSNGGPGAGPGNPGAAAAGYRPGAPGAPCAGATGAMRPSCGYVQASPQKQAASPQVPNRHLQWQSPAARPQLGPVRQQVSTRRAL